MNPAELLEIDDSMREFFAQRIPLSGSDEQRLQHLVSAILGSDGMGFVYDGTATFDARETFRRRRGNCASYSFLLVAVAREFGFDAAFQHTDQSIRWARIGGLVAVIRHLNVRITTQDRVYIADLRPNILPPSGAGLMRVIRDETAAALFYSNISFGHLVDGRPDEALRYLTLAVAVDPSSSSAWANRGLVQSRWGDVAAARADFERALRVDRRNELALEGYSRVLRRLGTPADLRRADQLERKVRAIRGRNPYYQHYLASEAIGREEFSVAETRLRRAIALKGDEHEFYAQWVSVLERLGREADARRATKRLDKIRAKLAAESNRFPR